MEAMYSWFAADWATCKRAIDNGVKNAEDSGIHLLDLYLMAQGVFGGLSLGDALTAESCLNTMLQINSPRLGDKALYQYQASSVAWHYGDYKKSAEHGRQGVKISEEIGWPIAIGLCLTELAITLCDDGYFDEADACLVKATETCRGMIGMEFLVSLNCARFAFRRGSGKQGLVLLKRSLALGARYGFMNVPRWNGANMSLLCAKALEHNIETEYVRKLIRVRGLSPERQVESWPYPIKIYTLGRFEIIKDGIPMLFSGKVQKKPLELLKALVSFGGEEVSEGQINDALWPDAEGDSAHKSFEITLNRLRKLIGNEKYIVLNGGCLTLNNRYCWTDIKAFDGVIKEAEERWNESRIDDNKSIEALKLTEKAMDLYRGKFMPMDAEQSWTAETRERMENRLIRIITTAGSYYEQKGLYDRAIEFFRKGIEIDGLAEELYQRLMLCYQRLGQEAEAVKIYNRCRNAISHNLGVMPSSKTEDIYNKIRKTQTHS